MSDPKTFSFDTEKFAEFFKQNDFTKQFASMKVPGFDTEALMATQSKNMEALVAANKAAAAGYQDLFKKQMAIFEETMTEAQKALKGFDATKLDAESAKVHGEVAKAAFETALASMQDLAESAQRANAVAYKIVSARTRKSLLELRGNQYQSTGVHSFEGEWSAGRLDMQPVNQEEPELPSHLVKTWPREAPRRNLAAEFRRMRREAGLSQATVAERMGVLQPIVARMESAVGPWPREEAIASFARVCGKDAVIVFRDEPISGASDAGVVRL